ncbi:MAG: 30S ribosomal protein S8e [archaeon]|nr:30S ribosomal protein S8e [archaeon]
MNYGRKITGGKYHKFRKTRKLERKGQEKRVFLGELKRKIIRILGGNKKTFVLKSDIANVIEKGKAKKAKIINVEETPQNKFFARQNRLVKGAIILTSLGKARITNRPSQEGHVNAVLIGK